MFSLRSGASHAENDPVVIDSGKCLGQQGIVPAHVEGVTVDEFTGGRHVGSGILEPPVPDDLGLFIPQEEAVGREAVSG